MASWRKPCKRRVIGACCAKDSHSFQLTVWRRKLFNHFYRCAGISSQGQQVDIAAVNQSESDGTVAQAVKRAVVAMWALLEVQVFQYPIETPTDDIQHQASVVHFRKKHMVVRCTITLCFLVFQDMFEKWNGGCQANGG